MLRGQLRLDASDFYIPPPGVTGIKSNSNILRFTYPVKAALCMTQGRAAFRLAKRLFPGNQIEHKEPMRGTR